MSASVKALATVLSGVCLFVSCHGNGSAFTNTQYLTLLAFVASNTVLAMVVVAIVIAGICIYEKRERKLIWTDLEGGESWTEKNRASDHVVSRGSHVSTVKDFISEPGGADDAKEAEHYDVVGDEGSLDYSGSYTNIRQVINRTRSMGPEEETAGKKHWKRDRRERDRREGDRREGDRREGDRREGDRREGERREKKKTSDQMELNVSSTTTTSADVTSSHVDGDNPYELYEN